MSKFNQTTVQKSKTTNLAGGDAYQQSQKLELVSILLSSFLKDSFYESGESAFERLNSLCESIEDKEFLAKAAIFSRNKFYTRSTSHVLAAHIASKVNKCPWVKYFYRDVIARLDDMNEIMSLYMSSHAKSKTGNKKRPIPNSMKKGFKLALNKFDNYQISKYKSAKKDLKLIDIVNLIHPKPNEINTEALKKLVKNELAAKDTWEARLTQAGQQASNEEEKKDLKADAWKDLILSRKIGYMALIRNLRNIVEVCDEDTIEKACVLIQDKILIKNSKMFPFRFLTAVQEVEKISSSKTKGILDALNSAIDISLDNVPEFSGKTLIALDVSGSMSGKPAEIGALFSVVMYKKNPKNVDIITFSDDAKYRSLTSQDSTLTLSKSISFASGGTNFKSIFDKADKAYDRIIILSDMQAWISSTGYWEGSWSDTNLPSKRLEAYRRKYSCKPLVYSFDLSSYGTLQFPEKDVICLAGFSDKVFDLMSLAPQRDLLINEIDKVELQQG